MKHLRSDEAASLEISKNGNGQEAFLQQVGEYHTSRDNAAESNMQLCDKLSAAVITSGSKDEPADETSLKAADNCASVGNVSAQLAEGSSKYLCVNLISLAVAAHCAPNETTKNASGRNRSVKFPLGEAERHQKQFHGKDFSVFGFGASSLASTIFTLASAVLKPLQEVFKLTLCFPALHALFENLSASVVEQLPCERGVCRYLFDRGKHSAVRCVSSFVQKHTSERKETATSHQPGIGRTTVVPATACASSEKQLQVASTFGSENIEWAVVAVRLSSFDTLLARQDLKVLRETFADVSKSVGTCYLPSAQKEA